MQLLQSAPQPRHAHVDGATLTDVHQAAARPGQALAAEHGVGFTAEGDQQRRIATGESDQGAIGGAQPEFSRIEQQGPDPEAVGLEGGIADLCGISVASGRGAGCGARLGTQQPFNTQLQLAEHEWLAQVVVGTEFQACDAIAGPVEGGQHQDWEPMALAAQAPQHIEAALERQHLIQQQEVGGAFQESPL